MKIKHIDKMDRYILSEVEEAQVFSILIFKVYLYVTCYMDSMCVCVFHDDDKK